MSEHEYTVRRATGISGLPPQQIRRWARAGFVAERKRGRARWHLSFQDLALLKALRSLRDAGSSFNRVTRTMRKARDQSRPGTPLSAIAMLVRDQRIVFRDRSSTWDPETRQATFDFNLRPPSRQGAVRIEHYVY